MKRQLRAAAFVYAERVYGTLHSGQIDEPYVLYTLDHLYAPTKESSFHPAVYPADCMLNATEQQGMRECAALTSPRVCRRTQELGIELMSYFDLGESQ